MQFSASQLFVALSSAASLAAASKGSWGPAYPDKQLSQQFYDNYNNIKYLGGGAPYSDGRGFGISRNPPSGCEVDQVIMLSRHGERYPDPGTYKSMVTSLDKLWNTNITYKDGLAFFNDWQFWITDPSWIAQETTSGPYGGLLDGYHRGNTYRARYGHLWDGTSQVPIFTSGYERVIETARKFGEGFFGYNYTEVANVNIISENSTQGADSLTPVCYKKDNTSSVCESLDSSVFPQFKVAAARLNEQNKGLNLNYTDITALMTVAAYELNARPYSPWIDLFTTEEWITYSYYNDLSYYYCDGPGNDDMFAVGAVYANATLSLLKEGPSDDGDNSMFFSFCHDTNITPVLAALGLFVPENHLPVNGTIPFGHNYHSTDFVPMGGHFVIERLSCNATTTNSKGSYVRMVVNEAVIPLNECSDGPGFSCSLSNYTTYLGDRLPDYAKTCEVPSDYPQNLEFFWKWNETKAYNQQNGSVSYQLGATDI